jgi:hypothetical protein
MRSDDMLDAMIDVCVECGLTHHDYIATRTKRHRCLIVNINGVTRKLFFSSSPSDIRAIRNQTAFVRRTIRNMQARIIDRAAEPVKAQA